MADPRYTAAQPGDKVRCRYCGLWLVLSPWKVLDDGWTQVYHWVGVSSGARSCFGKKRRGKPNTLSEPEHRPTEQRLDMRPASRRVASQ